MKTSNSQNDKKSIFELANQFYFYKIIHEFSKGNIPDARVNKWKREKNTVKPREILETAAIAIGRVLNGLKANPIAGKNTGAISILEYWLIRAYFCISTEGISF